jgi:phenylpropionate dioxygenase-like ring-hydroxylating dioxygenase large terminal subunit
MKLDGEIYRDVRRFEKEVLHFQNSWQLLCHAGEIPLPGDSITRRWAGCSVLAERAPSGEISCVRLPERTKVEIESVEGLVFAHLGRPQFTMRDAFSPFVEELREVRSVESRPLEAVSETWIAANWKLLVEISLDETHVESVHPQVAAFLSGAEGYVRHANIRRWHQGLSVRGRADWKSRLYFHLARHKVSAPEKLRWTYLWIFPGTEIEIYPEQIAYYQTLPVTPELSLKRALRLGVPSRNPLLRLLRALNGKMQEEIDAQDVGCVIKRQNILGSLEPVELRDSASDRLVHRFHEEIDAAVAD